MNEALRLGLASTLTAAGQYHEQPVETLQPSQYTSLLEVHFPTSGSTTPLPPATPAAAPASPPPLLPEAASSARVSCIRTPQHECNPFTMQLLAPSAFRQLWSQFGMSGSDVVAAICSHPLTEISNPGASGSEFYKSWDDQFFLKSASKAELDFLMAMMPSYLASDIDDSPASFLVNSRTGRLHTPSVSS